MKNNLNKDRLKIYTDFDSTICLSDEVIINTYNQFNKNKPLKYIKEHDWKFRPIIQTDEQLKELFSYFDNPHFYDKENFRWVDDNCCDVLHWLVDNGVDLTIITKHEESRRKLTKEFIDKEFDGKVKVVFVDSFKKSDYMDYCDIFIGDHMDELNDVSESRKADNVLAYGDYLWNKEWKGLRFTNWKGIKYFIIDMYGYKLKEGK